MKKGKRVQIKIRFSNRWLYTFIAFGILILAGIGVYATSYTNSNTGHPYTEITTCAEGQFLKVINGVWTCETYFASKDENRCQTIGFGEGFGSRRSDSRTFWLYGAYSNIPYYEDYSAQCSTEHRWFICPVGTVLSGVISEPDSYSAYNPGNYGPSPSYHTDEVERIICC
ncbi:MAG: hypothetical protein WC511_04885 [Candidatus Pacearchaeota archaeon]|jgi:hypothetical protein